MDKILQSFSNFLATLLEFDAVTSEHCKYFYLLMKFNSQFVSFDVLLGQYKKCAIDQLWANRLNGHFPCRQLAFEQN